MPVLKNNFLFRFFSKPRKKKKRKEVFKFHFLISLSLTLFFNVFMVAFVKEWREYFLFWDYSILLWLIFPLLFCLIYAFCRAADIRIEGVRTLPRLR